MTIMKVESISGGGNGGNVSSSLPYMYLQNVAICRNIIKRFKNIKFSNEYDSLSTCVCVSESLCSQLLGYTERDGWLHSRYLYRLQNTHFTNGDGDYDH